MKDWLKKNLVTVIIASGLVVGVCLLLYPSVANYWNSFHQTRAIITYSETVSDMDPAAYKSILDEAREYNAGIAETGIRWTMSDSEKEEYNSVLSVDGSGIIGYISIPKFHIKVPIYHGTEESVLQVAIGHLEGSSLPVGGPSTHCLVSGHRGLPSARLFTDLDKIKEGDTWTITVMNETLTYECDQIRIVTPDDLTELKIIEGEDLCTLITCTPYGVNTHRLLVRGHRVPNANGAADVTADGIQIEPVYIAPVLAVPALIIIFAVLLLAARRARRINTKAIQQEYLKSMGINK